MATNHDILEAMQYSYDNGANKERWKVYKVSCDEEQLIFSHELYQVVTPFDCQMQNFHIVILWYF